MISAIKENLRNVRFKSLILNTENVMHFTVGSHVGSSYLNLNDSFADICFEKKMTRTTGIVYQE